MAQRPAFLQDGTPETETWLEIERNGHQQGVDPSLGPVAIQAPSPAFRQAIDNLVAVRGAAITEENRAANVVWVQLTYAGHPGTAVTRDPTEAAGKFSIQKV